MKFEIVSKYADAGLSLPVRKTVASAGYDFQVAEDTIIPSYQSLIEKILNGVKNCRGEGHFTLQEMAQLTKDFRAKPTLVPTGIKCELPKEMYLELSVRSSCPLKHWLVLANGVGIIDADYYNNPDNEGHIYFQLINLSPFDIILHKGDTIGQGIIKQYFITDDDAATGLREGGFGSTDDNIITTFNEVGQPNAQSADYIQLGLTLFNNNANAEEECVMACNPNRFPYIVGKRHE